MNMESSFTFFSITSLESIVDSISLGSNIGSNTSSMLDITPAKSVFFSITSYMKMKMNTPFLFSITSNMQMNMNTSFFLSITSHMNMNMEAPCIFFGITSLESIVDSISLGSNIGSNTCSMLDITPAKSVFFNITSYMNMNMETPFIFFSITSHMNMNMKTSFLFLSIISLDSTGDSLTDFFFISITAYMNMYMKSPFIFFSITSLESVVDSISLGSNIGSNTCSMLDITPAKSVFFSITSYMKMNMETSFTFFG